MLCNAQAIMLFTDQLSDNKGASLLLPQMPKAKLLLVNQGYNANYLRGSFLVIGFPLDIPLKCSRKKSFPMMKVLTKKAIFLKTSLQGSKSGEELLYDMIVGLTLSSALFASLFVFSFIFMNES